MKIKEFLNQTTEIRNGDRLTILVGTTILTGIGLVLNHKLMMTRIDSIFKDVEIEKLKIKLQLNEEFGNKNNNETV